jgi:hypothetical protein
MNLSRNLGTEVLSCIRRYETVVGEREVIICCAVKERSGIVWCRLGVWDLRGLSGGCKYLREEESSDHLLYEFAET